MAENATTYEGWVILELLGHRRLAGYLSERVIGGTSFLQIEVPHGPDDAATTQFYSAGSVYCITPTTEELARKVAVTSRPRPVQTFELPAPDDQRGDEGEW